MDRIGIEMAHGFGDGVFSIPLVEALCKRDGAKAVIASERRCMDVYYGVPGVDEIIAIPNMNHGQATIANKSHVSRFYQITPQYYFERFKQQDPNHSLACTAMAIGREYGVDIDPRPKIYLSPIEIKAAENYFEKFKDKGRKIVAVESEHLSCQSWTNDNDFEAMVTGNPDCFFLWLSLRRPVFDAPNMHVVAKDLDRRGCIALLNYVDLFVSVGSGFFCSSLSASVNPPKTWALWIDTLYKYKDTINATDWTSDLTWIESREEWQKFLQHNKP